MVMDLEGKERAKALLKRVNLVRWPHDAHLELRELRLRKYVFKRARLRQGRLFI